FFSLSRFSKYFSSSLFRRLRVGFSAAAAAIFACGALGAFTAACAGSPDLDVCEVPSLGGSTVVTTAFSNLGAALAAFFFAAGAVFLAAAFPGFAVFFAAAFLAAVFFTTFFTVFFTVFWAAFFTVFFAAFFAT